MNFSPETAKNMRTMSALPKEINSPKNEQYKRWLHLHKAQGIQKYSQCLVTGSKIVPEIMEEFPNLCVELIVSHRHKDLRLHRNPKTPGKGDTEATPPSFSDFTQNALPSIQTYVLPQALFKKLDVFSTNFPLLIAKTPPIENFSSDHPPTGLEVLCGLGDPTNVGALARCCEAFNARKLILLESSAHPFLPKTIRSSSGSVFRISLENGPPMEEIDFDVIALDQQGEKVEKFPWPKDVRLLMGTEGQGLPSHLKATKLFIPMASGSLDSLNAVAASSIALHSYYQSLDKKI